MEFTVEELKQMLKWFDIANSFIKYNGESESAKLANKIKEQINK